MLCVSAVPYFTLEPDFVNQAEDESVEFKCAASGVPEPQIKWIHNGVPISESPPNPRRKVSSQPLPTIQSYYDLGVQQTGELYGNFW